MRLELEKQEFLRYLIDDYNDGRSKSFYCISCQLIPLDKLKKVLEDTKAVIVEARDVKEKAEIVRAAILGLAGELQVDLKLRR